MVGTGTSGGGAGGTGPEGPGDDPGRGSDAGGVTVVETIGRPAAVRAPGFFDPRDPGSPLEEIVLCRLDDGGETFRLDRPIGYWDADLATRG